MPEISFIENMSLQETEELVRANYTRIFKELTGQDAELGEADAKNLIIKSFSLVLYQVMQYVEAKGRAELLKTSTGDALDALAALFGITRQEARRATCIVRFTLSGQRSEPTAIPAGTRVKTQDGKYFNTVEYGEIAAGETWTCRRRRPEQRAAASPPERSTRWWTPSPTLRAWRA